MNTRFLAVSAILIGLAGCRGAIIVERPERHPVVVASPPPVVVVQPAPTYVEEGAVVGGVVVAPVAAPEYVFINGGWYYWHPGVGVWVHAHPPEGWRPGPGVRVYTSWGQHPMYRPVAVERPVVVAPAPAPVVVVQPAPAFVEEGAVVGGVVVAPVAAAEVVFINGGYYYWHPTLHVWVHAHHPEGWRPGPGVRVYTSWGEHPMYHR